MKKIITTVILLFLLTVAAFAGPFGLEFGMTLDEVKQVATIERVAKNNPFMYFITPNKKSNLLETYRVCISQKYGVFDITAFGYEIEADEYGDKIKNEMSKYLELIKKNYGEPTGNYDFLKSGSIWKEENDWLTALRKKERFYSFSWNISRGAQLPEPIQIITIDTIFANSYSNDCCISLVYQAKYYDEALNDALDEENVF